MLNVVIFGAPGSGKGTQSEKLIEKYGLSHVSTGDLLRAEMKVKSQLGQMAESYMSRGQLVPDDVVVGMLEGLIKKNNHVKGFIFDGFPRTLAQGKALDAMLVKYDEKVNVVLSLEVEDEELIARLLKRRLLLVRVVARVSAAHPGLWPCKTSARRSTDCRPRIGLLLVTS